MRAAHACGIDVAHTEHTEFASETAIVITRFDRVEHDGSLTRLHQEDLCQALGLAEKYQEHGGPGVTDIIRLLRERSATASAARRNVDRFVDGLVFNTVITAPDAHARNYATFLDGEHVDLAPLFDVSTALPYGPPARGHTLSMSVDGEYVAERVTRDHWLRFAEDNQLDGERLVTRAHELLETAPRAMLDALDAIGTSWDGSSEHIRERLVAGLDAYIPTVQANLGAR